MGKRRALVLMDSFNDLGAVAVFGDRAGNHQLCHNAACILHDLEDLERPLGGGREMDCLGYVGRFPGGVVGPVLLNRGWQPRAAGHVLAFAAFLSGRVVVGTVVGYSFTSLAERRFRRLILAPVS